jgi:hypothetical protein
MQGRIAASKNNRGACRPGFQFDRCARESKCCERGDSDNATVFVNTKRQARTHGKGCRSLREGIIQRLPFSRREAESILAAVPAGEKKQALDLKQTAPPL